MNEEQSQITQWIQQLKEGDEQAAQQIWDKYFQRLVGVARKRLGDGPNRVADEEDVAINVFASLCRGAAKGNFEQLTDRQDLWMLLLTITKQKSVDEIRHRTRQKRGGGAVRGESIFNRQADQSAIAGLSEMTSDEPTPELLMSADENFQYLLGLLRDETLSRIACMRMEGYTNDEVADQLQISTRSVERKLKLIRDTWENEID